MPTKRNSKYYQEIGRNGGRARIQKYGNPGTPEGRSKGGKVAMAHLRQRQQKGDETRFVTAKKIAPIRKSIFLAEFIGVLFGDGHVGQYQTSITLDSKTDREYAEYLRTAMQGHFHISPSVRFRKNARALDLVISSVVFCKQMVRFGMVQGNKLRGELRVPKWVADSQAYTEAFLRGLFDTDGSVYGEVKRIKGKEYRYIGMIITSASPALLTDVADAFQRLGFLPTYTPRQKSVFLRRQDEVEAYFSRVTSHNPKHSVRYQKFLREKCESG